jgi:hypothetical protein
MVDPWIDLRTASVLGYAWNSVRCRFGIPRIFRLPQANPGERQPAKRKATRVLLRSNRFNTTREDEQLTTGTTEATHRLTTKQQQATGTPRQEIIIKMESQKTKEQFAEDLKVLEDGQTAFQKEFVELKKAKADKAQIDEVLNRLKDGKERIAALVLPPPPGPTQSPIRLWPIAHIFLFLN